MYANRKHPWSLRGQLAEALASGQVFEPKRDKGGHPVAVPAKLIRELLKDVNSGATSDPSGLRLRGVRIQGRIDLDHVRTSTKLELVACEIPQGLTAKHADLAELVILDLVVSDYCADEPILDLGNARLETLDLSGAWLSNQGGPVLDARGVNIRADAHLYHFKAEGSAEAGVIRFSGATIGGQLVMNSASLTGRDGPALNLGGIYVKNGAYFRNEFSAEGEVRMPGAHIGGKLVMSDASLNCADGPALFGARLRVETNAYFENLTATGTGEYGAVCFLGGTLGGTVYMDGASLKSSRGSALNLTGVAIGNNAYFKRSFCAEGAGDAGTVRLPGAAIGGHLVMSGAALINAEGPALIADRLKIGGNAHFKNEFQAQGNGELGLIRLAGASVGGQLVFDNAEVATTKGPALIADRIKVSNTTHLNGKFTTCSSEAGALSLIGADIAGNLKLTSLTIENHNGPAIIASSMTVSEDLLFELSPEHCDVDLRNTAIQGQFLYTPQPKPDTSSNSASSRLWNIAGFTYGTLGSVEQQKKWLSFLAAGTSVYSPQPYQQFVEVALREGHEDLALEAEIMRHDDLLQRSKSDRNLLSKEGRRRRVILKYGVGYGYLPWLAWGWLLVIFLVYLSILLLANGMVIPWQALELVDEETQVTSGPCAPVDVWLLAWEIVPLVDGFDTQCAPVGWKTTLVAIHALFGAGAWAAVTLFVVGFTSLIRKPGR